MFSGERLAKRRQELGMSQSQLAEKLGISRPSYHNWESGKTKPNQKNLQRLSEILKVESNYFLSQYDIVGIFSKLTKPSQDKVISYSQSLLEKESKLINLSDKKPRKLYSYKVYEKLSAGTGFTYFNDGNYDEVFYDEKLDHDFASWVFGNSMEPTYLNGEVVLIKQTGFDYDGAVYAVDWNGETYIKRVYREEDGLRLVSINDAYEDMHAPYEENPRIIGKIVGNFMPTEV
ncbi:helix-turn-helix domain-containing protein [Streptococcus loxodontisalivarius]|uniref:Phage repressor protein C with HTH and peptisase S24 domain n=1 Tax=Streptococcus loxodontisalivarius TaxID=1349415 RepID=A0ABS2PV96_9STRE|nr:XRE family transcriptional regulator [Streptococcus loxodontisalivarius]MBM7643806.1 phage repressor protein C with HTH and peptisase S24 domain [Streptococcus loxodontisalivarius]